MSVRTRLRRTARIGVAGIVIAGAALAGLIAAPAQAHTDTAATVTIGDATLQDDGSLAVPVTRSSCAESDMPIIMVEVRQSPQGFFPSAGMREVGCNDPTIVIVQPSSEPFQLGWGSATATVRHTGERFHQNISINK
jgi:hypothetical protein